MIRCTLSCFSTCCTCLGCLSTSCSLLRVPHARPAPRLPAHAAPGGRAGIVAPTPTRVQALCRSMDGPQLRDHCSLIQRAPRCDSACVAAGVRVHSSILHTPIAVHCHRWPLFCITPLAPSRASLHPASIALAALCTLSTASPV